MSMNRGVFLVPVLVLWGGRKVGERYDLCAKRGEGERTAVAWMGDSGEDE